MYKALYLSHCSFGSQQPWEVGLVPMKDTEVMVPENLGPGLQSQCSFHHLLKTLHSTSSLDPETETQKCPLLQQQDGPSEIHGNVHHRESSTAASRGMTHRSRGALGAHRLEAWAPPSVMRNE